MLGWIWCGCEASPTGDDVIPGFPTLELHVELVGVDDGEATRVEDGDAWGVIDDGEASGAPEDWLASGPVEDGETSGVAEDGETAGVAEDGEASGPVEDGDASGPVEDGETSGVLEYVDTSEVGACELSKLDDVRVGMAATSCEGVLAEEAIDDTASLSPEELISDFGVDGLVETGAVESVIAGHVG